MCVCVCVCVCARACMYSQVLKCHCSHVEVREQLPGSAPALHLVGDRLSPCPPSCWRQFVWLFALCTSGQLALETSGDSSVSASHLVVGALGTDVLLASLLHGSWGFKLTSFTFVRQELLPTEPSPPGTLIWFETSSSTSALSTEGGGQCKADLHHHCN